ncbi:MAG TPA: Uma2 family endonuclease [Lichenihabitans sp.]|jgi:Uma2 family endonuclease|nr:Uma2 family endonuclease [Lichenihabitans sp.]
MPTTLLKQPAMSPEEYLDWHQRQDERYEYVDGAPQLKHVRWDGPRMMVGATQAHMLLSFNVAKELDRQLRDGRCRAVVADGKVVTPRGNYRYPDVAVDCGPFSATSTVLAEPNLVVEIWSKSTRWIDLTRKLDDYRSMATVQAVLFLSQETCSGQLWTRGEPWDLAELDGREAEAAIPSLGLTLPFATIYQGLDVG